MTVPGVGNEPKGDSLKGNIRKPHRGWFIGVIASFAVENQQVVWCPIFANRGNGRKCWLVPSKRNQFGVLGIKLLNRNHK